MKKKLLKISVVLTALLFGAVLFSPAAAKVSGPCNNCHTMHNSQNGSSMALTGAGWDGATLQGTPTDTPNSRLTITTCVGCHTATTGGTIIDLGDGTRVPIVNSGGGYPASPLAGGNFNPVSGNHQKGHNVEGIAGEDSNLSIVPGQQIGGNDQLSISDCLNCHIPALVGWPGIPFVKTRTGDVLICEDCHTPRHHTNDSATLVDGAGGWYRFLYEVKGIEDPDWEQTVTSQKHNEYQGETASYGNSISDKGCACHGQYHALRTPGKVGDGSPWLKHPADVALPTTGEYAAYIIYDPQAPVARPDLSGYTDPTQTVTPGVDQVMCLSCHRPHGTLHDDILRWDYQTMQAGGGSNTTGCFICHTKKDTGGS
jgi:predicted CXXCH cytochrome family protein